MTLVGTAHDGECIHGFVGGKGCYLHDPEHPLPKACEGRAGVMFPDADILERRLRQLERLPWPVPAAVIMRMTEADFDDLDMASDNDEWWRSLNAIVVRVTESEKGAA